MKKIFFVLTTNVYSGAEAVNLSIINNLSTEFDFYWVSPKGDINNYLKQYNIKYIEIDKLSVSEMRRVIKEYEPDIIHATDYRVSLVCNLATNKIPIIAHLHNNCNWLSKIHPYTFALLYVMFKSKKVLTVSDSIENEYLFKKIVKNKFCNIGNPIDRNKIINSLSEDNKKVYDICCVARLTKQKNPYKFISIIEKVKKDFPNVKAIWIGQGELLEDCKNKCKEMNLEENISFIGFQKNPYNYINKSKIFLLTSDWEGYGLVAFESITLGVPAVVSKVGGLPDIIDNNCGKLCEKDNDYVIEITKLLNDKSYYIEKSNNSIIRSKEIENIKKYMSNIKEIYNDL